MIEMYENMIYPTIRTQLRKKYISAAVWNYIHTPINFIISLFTGLTAGQAGSSTSYLSRDTVFVMLFVCFILSTINIFFKLREKAELNFLSAKSYEAFINEYLTIYILPLTSEGELELKLGQYKALKTKIDTYVAQEKIDSVNYFTECLYFLVQKYKARKTLNMLFENATDDENEIFKQRMMVLRDMRHKGIISQQEMTILMASLDEKLKNNSSNKGKWPILWGRTGKKWNFMLSGDNRSDSSDQIVPSTPKTGTPNEVGESFPQNNSSSQLDEQIDRVWSEL